MGNGLLLGAVGITGLLSVVSVTLAVLSGITMGSSVCLLVGSLLHVVDGISRATIGLYTSSVVSVTVINGIEVWLVRVMVWSTR